MSLQILNIQGDKALVRNGSKPSFTVTMQSWLKHLVCVGDIAIVKKSPVSGEWFLTDYVRNIDNVGGYE